MHPYRIHRCGVISLLLASTGCSLLTPSYEEITLESAVSKLGAECASCLQTTCEDYFAACEADAECVNYAFCRLDGATPVSHYACSDQVSERITRRFDGLLRCLGCAERCRLGQRWECVGRFAWPEPEAASLRWEHRLLDSLSGNGIVGASVHACHPGSLDCTSGEEQSARAAGAAAAVASGTTDATGTYSLELPVSPFPNPERPGFNGYFQVLGGGVYPHRIQFTAPLFRDGMDATSLFSTNAIETLLPALGITLEPGRGHLLVQVFDCLRTAAEGIEVLVSGAGPEADRFYGRYSFPSSSATTTSNEGSGTAAVLNLDPAPQIYQVTFRVAATQKVVFATSAPVVADRATLLIVTPGSSGELVGLRGPE